MEHFSRRRWRLVSAQLSIKFCYCPWCTVSIVLYFHKHNSLPLGAYKPSSPVSCRAPQTILTTIFTVNLKVVLQCLHLKLVEKVLMELGPGSGWCRRKRFIQLRPARLRSCKRSQRNWVISYFLCVCLWERESCWQKKTVSSGSCSRSGSGVFAFISKVE